ncbi:FRG domain-containing protein [Pedobacter nototheniae]|uniref:FRG domain-containing protein n=1 Tax=Pedobacter nototheniae TaxID=2488994 RepID=UPI001040AD61|nr:FRG domain-containing protein [Pedobacter nototheniae]
MENDNFDFEPIETRVGSLNEALALAEKWQAEGKYDLFRGQAKNWEVVSSLHRIPEKDFQLAQDSIMQFYYFVSENKILQKHLDQVDELFAIAQHYGMPTNYIDFTSEPRIAGYFATHSKSNEPGQDACIICVDTQDFSRLMKFAEPILKRYLKPKDLRPCMLQVTVPNLWRLEAQHGRFLYTPFKGIEHFYQFNRILFPFDEPSTELNESEIYPLKKSTLESSLDHFFEAERRSKNMAQIKAMLRPDQITTIPESSIFDYVHPHIRKHSSWQKKQIQAWLERKKEDWHAFQPGKSVTLELRLRDIRSLDTDAYILQLETALDEGSDSRQSIFFIHIQRDKGRFNEKLQQRIDRGCNIIWDGMRILPYSNHQIATAIIRFVFMVCRHHKSPIGKHNPLLLSKVLVEMTNGDGAHSRAQVCGYGVLDAKRKAVGKYIKEGFNKNIDDNPIALLQLIYKPQYLFRFEALCNLFASDVIPSQMVLESDSEYPTVYFNPAHLKIFGLA